MIQNIDLTPVVQGLIVVIGILITRYLVPWLKAKMTIAQREKLAGVVETFVFAAEQIYGSGWGKDKLHYVEARLLENGYTVDIDLIEATVRKHFGHTDSAGADDPVEEEEPTEDEEPQTPLM